MKTLVLVVILVAMVVLTSGCGGHGGGGSKTSTAQVVITATLSALPPESQSPADRISVTIAAPGQDYKWLTLNKITDTSWTGSTEVAAVPKVKFRALGDYQNRALYEGITTQDIVANINNTVTIVMTNVQAKTIVNITASFEDTPGKIRDVSDIKSAQVTVDDIGPNAEYDIKLKKVSDTTWSTSVEIMGGLARKFEVSAGDQADSEIFRGTMTQDVIYGSTNDIIIPAKLVFPSVNDGYNMAPPPVTGIDPEVGYYSVKNADGSTSTVLRVTQDPSTGKKYAERLKWYLDWSGGLIKIVGGTFYNALPGWHGYAISGWFTTPTHVEAGYKYRDYAQTTDLIHYSADLDR